MWWHDGVNRHPASISPSANPTTHSNSRNKDTSGTTPTDVPSFDFFSPLYACCNLPLHSLLLNHTFGKKNFSLLVLFLPPPAPHAALLEILLCLPADMFLNQPPPLHYTQYRYSPLHISLIHTHTHTHAESYTSLSRITTSHPQQVISSIFHLLCASSENSCYISLHDKQL